MSDDEVQRLRRQAIASDDPSELRRLAFVLEREGLAVVRDEPVDRMNAGTSGTGAPKELMKDIRALQRKYGSDDLQRGWAQHMISARWKAWKRHGMKRGPGCPLMLTGEHTSENHGDFSDCNPPGIDHPRMWFKRGKPVVFTMQPYSLYGDEVPGLADYCKQHHLKASITAYSCWYFPGSSILIEIAPENGRWWK